jgi:hypothetical protein
LLARAARIRARLVRLFEPGRTTVASVRRLGGTISMRSGSIVCGLCVASAASATGQRYLGVEVDDALEIAEKIDV